MPFAGSGVAAPIMAARQGMKDIAFSQVTDQAKPVLQFVKGALTGQGSGLQAPTTQSNAGPMQGAVTQAQQAAGQAMTIGQSEFWAPGATTGAVGGGLGAVGQTVAQTLAGGGPGGGPGNGGGGAAGSAMQAAQSLMGGGGPLGSVAAAAGSSLGLGGAGQASAGQASIGQAIAGPGTLGSSGLAGAGSVMDAVLPEVTPGQRPTAPQFTALPQIPSISRLQGVAAQLGAMASSMAQAALGKVESKVAGLVPGLGGSDLGAAMTSQPVSQFQGPGPAASYRADS